MSDSNLPKLRRVDEDEYVLRRQMNAGTLVNLMELQEDASNDSTRTLLKITLADPDLNRDSVLVESDDSITLSTHYGVWNLTNSQEVFSLLTGVPPPSEDDSRLLKIFRDICLTRLGKGVFSDLAPLRVESTRNRAEWISMALMVKRGDISALSIAKAPPRFWKALLQRSNFAPAKRPERRKTWPLNIPLEIAKGRFSISDISALRVGHIVQFARLSLTPDGYGAVHIGTCTLRFSLGLEKHYYLLKIESVRSDHIHRQISETEHLTMNDFDEVNDLTQTDRTEAVNLLPGSNSSPAVSRFGAQQLVDPRSIAVDVIAELGRLRLTVGELEELTPGSILKIACDQSRQVELKIAGTGAASDQLIAIGELVQVGARLAVQITHVQE